MPAPLLLVDDDLATIAQVKRLLAREGYEVVLATNAADAVIAWGHHLPKLVLISPRVESDRGRVVLEELRQHPDAQLLHVLLLGETLPGFGYPVAPLPLDPDTFGATVNELISGTTNAEGWQVHVAPSSRTDEYPAVQPPPDDTTEPDAWRASRKGVTPATKTATLFSTPEPTAIVDTAAEPTVLKTAVYGAAEVPEEAPPPPAMSPPSAELESSLFGDLEAQVAHEVETEAMASVDANLARMPVDRELQDLEDDVRAEAARRREKRLTGTMPSVGLPTPDRAPPPSEVDGFESFNEPAAAAPEAQPEAPASPPPAPESTTEHEDRIAARLAADAQKARELLARAEEIARAAAESPVSGVEVPALRAEVDRLTGELDAAHAALSERDATLAEKDSELATKDSELSAQELELSGKASELAAKDAELAGKDQELAAKDADLAEKGSAHGTALASKSAELEIKEGELMAKDAALADAKTQAESLAARLAQARETATELEAKLAAAQEQSEDRSARLESEQAERASLEAKLAALNAQTDELSTAAQRAAGDLREAIEEAEQSEARAQQQTAELDALRVRNTESEAGLEKLQAEVSKLSQDFTAAHETQRNLQEALEDAKAANLDIRTRAEAAEAKARLLEEKSVMPLKVPHRAPLSVAKFGTVELGDLARLVGQIVLARAEIRLELAASGGRRQIWLHRGAVAAAESTVGGESLLDRARRDGLIDARQTAELQMLRSATPAETVTVLKERGFLRDAEVVPLVQRFTEQVALDAFSEPTSEYRLSEELPGNETLAATLPRPTLPLVAEALRRALPVEELLHRLGGSDAIPTTLESALDLRALGFADKERRMLGYVDGEANVEDLALASGLKADVAFRAMLVAKLLGLIEVKAAPKVQVVPSAQLDVKRLDAKFEQVQDADYFTMLGLGRAAGGDEVLRAWQRLSEEFDPLKYSGHPDTGLQQRAQVVYSVLEEAAKALGDDRRRAEYARHLVD